MPFAQAAVTQIIDLKLEEDVINARAAFAAQIELDADGCPFCKSGCEQCRWGSSDGEGDKLAGVRALQTLQVFLCPEAFADSAALSAGIMLQSRSR